MISETTVGKAYPGGAKLTVRLNARVDSLRRYAGLETSREEQSPQAINTEGGTLVRISQAQSLVMIKIELNGIVVRRHDRA